MGKATYEVVESLGILSTLRSGYTKEVNIVSWNGGRPRLDIRTWSPDHEPGRGVILNGIEEEELREILEKRN